MTLNNLYPKLVPPEAKDILGDYRAKRQLKNIFPDNPELWHCVYFIGSEADLKALRLSKLYVGQSHHPVQRFVDHGNTGGKIGKKKRTLYSLITENGWTPEKNLLVIFYGTKEQCLQLEADLRPIRNMGLNKAPGGNKPHRVKFKGLTRLQMISLATGAFHIQHDFLTEQELEAA